MWACAYTYVYMYFAHTLPFSWKLNPWEFLEWKTIPPIQVPLCVFTVPQVNREVLSARLIPFENASKSRETPPPSPRGLIHKGWCYKLEPTLPFLCECVKSDPVLQFPKQLSSSLFGEWTIAHNLPHHPGACLPSSATVNHTAANNLANTSLTMSASLSAGRSSGWACGVKVYVCSVVWTEVTERFPVGVSLLLLSESPNKDRAVQFCSWPTC